MHFPKLIAASAMLSMAFATHSATIDRMYTATFGHYSQTFAPGGPFMVFSPADYYQLNDGTSWSAGAGTHPPTFASLASVSVVGNAITYTFAPPSGGLLFSNTDFDSGDHSSQGALGLPAALVITATLGSTVGSMSGYTPIVSNTETFYGQPRFNYYSASVGSTVYFEQSFTLLTGTFTDALFQGSFSYNESGFVDFLQRTPVPEPTVHALMIIGLFAVWRATKTFHGLKIQRCSDAAMIA